MKHKYDVFISYQSSCKPWVQILAENLQRANLLPFFDDWYLVRGQNLASQLEAALMASAKGILIVTREIAGSAWVREEYERMLGIKQIRADFRIIPLRVGGANADLPFLSNILAQDFSTPEEYPRSFHNLLCAIRDMPPGSVINEVPGLEIPRPQYFRPSIESDTCGSVNALSSLPGIRPVVAPPIPAPPARASEAVSPTMATDSVQRAHWSILLKNHLDSLTLINERMSMFVSATDIPLQLIKDRQHLHRAIHELQIRLGGATTSDIETSRGNRIDR